MRISDASSLAAEDASERSSRTNRAVLSRDVEIAAGLSDLFIVPSASRQFARVAAVRSPVLVGGPRRLQIGSRDRSIPRYGQRWVPRRLCSRDACNAPRSTWSWPSSFAVDG